MSDSLQVRDKRANDRFFIDNHFLRGGWGAKLGPYAIAVYNAVAMHADNDTQQAWPSTQRIADLTGMSQRQVARELQQLEKYRIVHIQSRAEERKPSIVSLLDKGEWLPVKTEGHMTESHKPDSQQTYDSESDEHMTGSHTNYTQGTKPKELDSSSGANAPTEKDPKEKLSLSRTPERRILCAKLYQLVFEPKGRRKPKYLPNLKIAQKFDEHANRLNSHLAEAIEAAIGQECHSLRAVTDYIAKWQPNGGKHAPNPNPRRVRGNIPEYKVADAAAFREERPDDAERVRGDPG